MTWSGFGLRAASAGLLVFSVLAGAASRAAVTISTAQTQNMSCTNGVCTPTAASAVLNVNDLENLLAGSNVQVNTGMGSLAQQVKDIIVGAGFNWASANSLTLDAYRSVTFESPVSVNGSGAVSLVTNDGGSGGNLSFISGGSLSFFAPTNSLSINGRAYTLVSNLPVLAADIAANPSGRYALSASYDASQDGTYKRSPLSTKFKGTFNGLGNAISKLAIDAFRRTRVGLFAHVDAKGAIDSVRVTNANVNVNDGKVRTGSLAGVVVALNYGTLFNDFASGQIKANLGASEIDVGGLVGSNRGVILDSGASAAVTAGSKSRPIPAVAGGLVGGSDGAIENSYATGSVTLEGAVGGAYIGGLVGFSGGPIQNCYADGNSTVPSIYAGGLVGYTSVAISTSYSTGTPSAGVGSYLGGFVGYDDSNGALSNTYWDTTTSGITNLSQGAGYPANDPGITGKTTAQLQAGLPAGFDPTIWAENPHINGGLPYLIANPPQ